MEMEDCLSDGKGCSMGMKPSPYNAVRYFYLAEEFARGNPSDPKNALRYDRVKLNLPGSKDFDPTLPMTMKWNDATDQLAGDVITFVDDLRASGFDSENAWAVARQVAARLQYLGIQDAARKRRPSTQKPGAWAGCVFQISPDKIAQTVTQEKWDKARTIVQSIADKVLGDETEQHLNHKELERQRGFFGSSVDDVQKSCPISQRNPSHSGFVAKGTQS
jgi:hypothetical protein